ncbi:MAG: 50S ribosomal protein L25 [Candidatus Pacebacteria bacterium]|nr:50S ribosomal protein L25 [Candidatus Paceibacterota bacterium]
MEKIILRAKKRTAFGKKNEDLRQKGWIPAILYGGKAMESCPLEVRAQDFRNVYKKAGDTNIIGLVIEGQGKNEEKNVLVQNISSHFLTGLPLHIDFYEVEMDKLVKAHIPIILVGEASAVSAKGGVLVKSMNEVEVEALPKDLPHEIPVDISILTEFGQTIYIRDIKFPSGVKVLIDGNTPVVSVSEPISEEKLEEELGKVKSVEEVEVAGEAEKEETKEGGEELKQQPKEEKIEGEEKEG